MKTLGLNSKKLLILLCVLVVGVFGTALFLLKFIYPIQSMNVIVETPTNASPLTFAMAATNKLISTNDWFIDIPFDQATNKFVSKTDIVQIKKAIPWNKTVLHLYSPKEIVIESPTNAIAEFSRQHIDLRVWLEKRNNTWQVDSINSSKWEMDRPLNLKERIAEMLPR